jgi:hypothetical protein
MNKDLGRIGSADRAASLRPQPPAASSRSGITLRGALQWLGPIATTLILALWLFAMPAIFGGM